MGKVTTYVCDGCGRQRGESNHWWQVFIGGHAGDTSLIICPMRNEDTQNVFCGAECVHKEVDRFLSGAQNKK